MSGNGSSAQDAPRFLSDARIRRMIAEAVKRRRAKRRRELSAFVSAIRHAERQARDGEGDA